MWTCNASTDSYEWITLTFEQNPYSGIIGYIYRSKSISTPIKISTISYYSGSNNYPDDPGEPGGYYYWIESLDGERSQPFYGIKLGGETPSASDMWTSSSIPDFSTSSSSFGDAVNLFYFVDKFGDLHVLRADANAQSSLIFKSFSPIINSPMGLAISYFPIDESSSSTGVLTTSSSSLSSESSTSGTSSSSSPKPSSSSSTSKSTSSISSSLSSQSTVNYDYNVYILRKKNSTTANMAIHDMSGYLKGSIDFSSAMNFLGMSVWPNNDNLLVAVSENSIHLFYIASGQIGMYSFESPVPLTYGIACKNIVDENSAEFFVRNKDLKEIVLIRINKKDKTCSFISQYACPLYKWQRLGGISCNLGTYGLIGEMSVVYILMEEEPGWTHISKDVILTGVPTLSYAFAMPFTVFGCSIPVPVTASPSLIESAKTPTLTFRRYDINGVFIESFSSLFLGNFQPGVKSAITIVNILAEGLTSMSNLKIGITENGISGADVSSTVMYGVSETIDPSFVLTKYFPGVNETNTSDNTNNIELGMKATGKSIESKYLYLQINVPKAYIGRGHLCFKFFFDYE